MNLEELRISLPDWARSLVVPSRLGTDAERMALAIEVSRTNVSEGSGGPFGAIVVERGTGQIVSIGMNLVVGQNNSMLHAEIVALMLAQRNEGRFDLSAGGTCQFELVTSCEPCAMCIGAIPWSGVSRVICGASDKHARSAGFDEGIKPNNWIEEFSSRGIEVVLGVCGDEAAGVLRHYAASGGTIYNSRS